MRRTSLLSMAALGVAAVLAIGSYSALAGTGPVARVLGAVIGAEGPEHADVVSGARTDGVANDVGRDDVEAQGEDEGAALGQGAQEIVQVIADEFGATKEQVLALREEGIGFGALFKLFLLSKATGKTVDQLLAEMRNEAGKIEFAFGKSFRGVELPADAPKNLGQLVSASHRSEGGAEEGEAVEGGAPAGSAHGQAQGPPEFAKAHGRR